MYYNTFAASAKLAYDQPSQEAPKIRIYVTSQLIDSFYEVTISPENGSASVIFTLREPENCYASVIFTLREPENGYRSVKMELR